MSRAWLALALAAATLAGNVSAGAEPYRAFLRGLWARGYGDEAVDYVISQRSRADLPADIRATIELDLARSMRIAARQAGSAAARERLLAAARGALDQFLHEQPGESGSADAHALMGELLLDEGEQQVAAAQAAGAEERPALLEAAREQLDRAKPEFDKAIELFSNRLAKLPPPNAPRPVAPPSPPPPPKTSHQAGRPKKVAVSPPPPPAVAVARPPTEREIVDEQRLEAMLKRVLVDYFRAQTFSSGDAFSRQEALKAAAEGFDDLYQHHRMDRAGLLAHFWEARVQEQLGDLATALDIDDEVLAIVPQDGGQLAPDVMDLLCQTEAHRLALLDKLDDRDTAIDEAEEWLEQFKTSRHAPGNLQIALELCRLRLKQAEALSGEQRRKMAEPAMTLLAEIVNVPGSHQREALLLWRKHQGADSGEAGGFAPSLSVAVGAARNSLWFEAAEAYAKAIQLARSADERNQVPQLRLELARAQLFSGKTADAMQTATALADDPRAGKLASAASLLAAQIAARRLAQAPADETAAATAEVERLASHVTQIWPRSTEADDARLMLAKLKLGQGELPSAITLLESIQPTSDRYAAALSLIGQAYWSMRLSAGRKPGEQAASDSAAAKAVAAFEAMIKLEDSKLGTGAPPSETLREALLLLAEIQMDLKRPDRAAPLIERLMAAIGPHPAKGDRLAARTLAVALKVAAANHDRAQAEQPARLLLASGLDQRQINSALVDYVRLVRADSGQHAATQAAGAAAARGGALALPDLLDKLATRDELSISDRIYLGTVARELSRQALAIVFLKGALDRAKQEQVRSSPKVAHLLAQVRLALVQLLRAERRYSEAASEADRLIADNPGVLQPLVEDAQVLEDWSDLLPDKLPEAVAAWTRVRAAVQTVQPKPPEYFDAIYHTADCLMRQFRQSHAEEHRLKAEQLLKATLALYPKVNGPEAAARFESLLQHAEAARPLVPAAK